MHRVGKIMLSAGYLLLALHQTFAGDDWAENLLLAAVPGCTSTAEEAETVSAGSEEPETAETNAEDKASMPERFAGYPEDRFVTIRSESTVEVADLRSRYPTAYIEDYDTTETLYVYSSSVLKTDPSYIDGEAFMSADVTADLEGDDPVILLFHTHGTEGYVGMETGGVLEVGDYLAEILSEQYGISVLHHTAVYDSEGTNGAYTRMAAGVEKILAAYPSIQVMIDLHRDGVDESIHLTENVDGSEVAQIMLVNGICQQLGANGELEPIEYLSNPYLAENLALSFRLKMASDVLYPGYMRRLYLARWQYSTYLRPLSLLLEVGAQTNTIEEAKAAMEPFAKVLYTVLTGNG